MRKLPESQIVGGIIHSRGSISSVMREHNSVMRENNSVMRENNSVMRENNSVMRGNNDQSVLRENNYCVRRVIPEQGKGALWGGFG